jgi:hypothetical protein
MVNTTIRQLVVLILMPIIGDQPPLVFLSPLFAAAVSDDGDMNQYSSFGGCIIAKSNLYGQPEWFDKLSGVFVNICSRLLFVECL